MLVIRRHVKVISKVSPTWFVRLIGVVFLELGMAPWLKYAVHWVPGPRHQTRPRRASILLARLTESRRIVSVLRKQEPIL